MSSHRPGETPTWNDERIEQLKQLWEQGLSASSIGRVLGVTKNAVVGKAHRLKLSARPSPIRKGVKPPVRRAAALARPTLPSEPMVKLPSEPIERAVLAAAPRPELRARPAKAVASRPLTARTQAPLSEPRARLAAPPPRQTFSTGRSSHCSWPVGDPGDADFHFCEAETLPGKPYCAEHCARAYVTKSRADSEAA